CQSCLRRCDIRAKLCVHILTELHHCGLNIQVAMALDVPLLETVCPGVLRAVSAWRHFGAHAIRRCESISSDLSGGHNFKLSLSALFHFVFGLLWHWLTHHFVLS